MQQAAYTFRLATMADRQSIIQFMNTHWEIRHPLVNVPDFFDYYYKSEGGRLQFALAFAEERLVALAGYILANHTQTPDVWVSIWVADKAAKGSGLELMATLPSLLGCRTLACNNIRPKTRPFYEFLGFTTGQVGHFYRLATLPTYQIARVAHKTIPPVSGNWQLHLLPTPQSLLQSGFVPPADANPYKDIPYIIKRYYQYPRQSYSVYGGYPPGSQTPAALLVLRKTPVQSANVLRIVDYIGPAPQLPNLGNAIDNLMQAEQAEYADIYCVGLAPQLLLASGFVQRQQQDENIIPNYLSPPLFENVDFYYFTNNPQNFTLFKADGDQDRPNIQEP